MGERSVIQLKPEPELSAALQQLREEWERRAEKPEAWFLEMQSQLAEEDVMPENDEKESSRAAPAERPVERSAPADRGLPEGIELIDLGGDRYQVRLAHRIVGTLVEMGGHQSFTLMGRNLGMFPSRRKAIDAMLENV